MPDGSQLHTPRRFGSFFAGTPAYRADVLRKSEAFGFLDRVCQAIEPTQTQQDRARSSYEAVGAWLAEDALLVGALIYAQGSQALGTMIRPVGHKEFDVDLICRLLFGPQLAPQALKALVGDRLKAHGYYRTVLEEKPRCWRLNYKGEFHLDITPAILNPACRNGGELVPDRKLQCYKASNPIGYRDLFLRRAALVPRTRHAKAFDEHARADVQPYPEHPLVKGILRRIVQLLKLHRDHYFRTRDAALAPLSIIITTLAMRAYELCVTRYEYDNELDLLCDTLRMMPVFIERPLVAGVTQFAVVNETTDGENFAEKWSADPRLAGAFYEWHERAIATFDAFAEAVGFDRLQKSLSEAIGEAPVQGVARRTTNALSQARQASSLVVKPGAGLAVATGVGTPVRSNTFFGR